uniref:Thymidine kinase n=1 Tax=Infectious laryngotracheitis virus TaxID=10386 RepID=A0A5C0NSJ7_ILTV
MAVAGAVKTSGGVQFCSEFENDDSDFRRVVLLYVDGPFGVGKTVTAKTLMQMPNWRGCRLYLAEPMQAWRRWFGGADMIKEINEIQTLKASGKLECREASRRVAEVQMTIAAPLRIMNHVIYNYLGSERCYSAAASGPDDVLFLVDRHPLAACLCFPVAQYLSGALEFGDLITLLSGIPDIPTHSNIVLMDLDICEQARRIIQRGRPGETVDWTYLCALRNSYICLMNTTTYLQRTSYPALLKEQEALTSATLLKFKRECLETATVPEINPSIDQTLFAILAFDQQNVHGERLKTVLSFVVQKLATVLKNLCIFYLPAHGLTPEACALKCLEFAETASSLTTKRAAIASLIDAVERYNADMGS